MEEIPNPLRIQELVHQCIDLLHDSPSDLQACALVSRSWASAAQANLFREVAFEYSSSMRRWSRLRDILRRSPHLIRHIHCLHLKALSGYLDSIEAFPAICQFPFTHLHYASIVFHHNNGPVSHSVGIAIQQIISLPTLQRVCLRASFKPASSFLQIWEKASASIRHLELSYSGPYGMPEPVPVPSHPPLTSIALDSLRITSLENIKDWLMHPLCPLDISHLKVLSIDENDAEFVPALRTIEVLDFEIVHTFVRCWIKYSYISVSSLPTPAL
ncbi:hypothetical protein B0H17DRAFT_1140404 [Mycena rosella]|uniref:F-box domain-containing protein n=1 Tax=Mycena rosella TaxID=1033263 RepID=A0AAD7D1Z9_MYCRO|nr:hypothetical protein B0H17DRAFT_1140404 [Mycena rosella]